MKMLSNKTERHSGRAIFPRHRATCTHAMPSCLLDDRRLGFQPFKDQTRSRITNLKWFIDISFSKYHGDLISNIPNYAFRADLCTADY